MNLLSKKQKVFPQLSFQLLWYMTLQVVLKNGPGMGFVLVFEAQIIVQDPVTFLTAGSERGLWVFAVPRHHHHPFPECSFPKHPLSLWQQLSVWHQLALQGHHCCLMQCLIVSWHSSGQASWDLAAAFQAIRGWVRLAWGGLTCLKWRHEPCHRTGANDGLGGSQTR